MRDHYQTRAESQKKHSFINTEHTESHSHNTHSHRSHAHGPDMVTL